MRTHSILSIVAFSFLAACGSVAVPPGQQIGEPVEPREVLTLTAVQEAPSDYYEQTLLVEARVKAVCQKMGCWMQIEHGGQPALVRWETGCGGKYSFPKDAIGERVLVQGSFYPKELSEEDAAHMAEEAGHKLEMPSKLYEMNASAVVLLDRK